MDRLDEINPPGWLDQIWETAAFYEFYAYEYGFLPSEVDGERRLLMELFPAVRSLRTEIHNEHQRRAAKDA